MGYIATVGSINADLRVTVQRHPQPGETLLGSGGEVGPGGKGANQAVAAALQGAQVRFVGAIGSDANAATAIGTMRAAGVGLEDVHTLSGPTGLAIISVSEDAENSIIVVPGANAAVDAEFVAQAKDTIAGADILLLQGEIPASGIEKAVELSTGRVVINLAPVVEVNREVLLKADPLMVNEHEAQLVLDQLGSPYQPTTTPQAPDELAQALLDQGFASVVITLGSKGALLATAEAMEHIAPLDVQPVDTTGAGDAFAGGFVAKLLQGASLKEAAEFANRVGAYAVQGVGAQDSYPTQDAELPS
ncbi:ribokinase [Corynebacterium kozikiae]|uniref:ribokinase n=1 Tax=Corynebacterium kozikiae TaxID=2968469 RepID=UPI00211C3EA1|nr:ribokinase [Corynebacterium sp. 76QC2CO]MCQ9343136.1 ribokinase [Corynebacterium sp. 76QC2CO]